MSTNSKPRSAGEDHMRLALIGLATIAAALSADVQVASAINYDSFFQERYCARREGGRWNCAYKSLEQCNFVTDPGRIRYCLENPWWDGPQGKSSKRDR
jgi:hypothetical protein